MAQHGAHVTQTLQAKPSIFEVVAADSLQATFHPALRRIANVNFESVFFLFAGSINIIGLP